MALLSVNNVRIAGISACVPAKVEENKDIPVFVEGSQIFFKKSIKFLVFD